jgi:hypothetical protein
VEDEDVLDVVVEEDGMEVNCENSRLVLVDAERPATCKKNGHIH